MGYNEENNYRYRIAESKRRRKRQVRIRILAFLFCAAVLAGITAFVLKTRAGRPEGTGVTETQGAAAETETPAETEPALSPEEQKEKEQKEEQDRVLSEYTKLGIARVDGYLNIRESADKHSDIVGKLLDCAACDILDDSMEEWYQISSGGITGYAAREFILTGEEAEAVAREQIAGRAVITADALRIRQEPNTEAEVVAQAYQNERYLVDPDVSAPEGWIKVSSGYISADYAEVKNCLNEARKLDMRTMVLNLYDNLGISSVENYLNVREKPGENEKIIGKMPSKSAGEILETTEDGKWYKIKSGPITGYVSSQYILTGDAAKDCALENAELMAIVSTDMLNARTEPSTDAHIWTQISNNERYLVLNQLDGWVEIELDENSAYVATDYVDVRYALNEAIKFSPLEEKASLRSQLVNYALQFVGNRYVWGGNDPHTGADCSGFVKYCYSHVAGITLERVSRSQAKQGTRVDAASMKPGDLVFYTNRSGTVNHVAMYIGNGQIVHAASRRSGIKISNWKYRTPYRIVNMLGD